MIRDKIVFGVRDNAAQERLLREADLSLERSVYICRTAETSKMQSSHVQLTVTYSCHQNRKKKLERSVKTTVEIMLPSTPAS